MIAQIADQLITELNGGTFSPTFVAARGYGPELKTQSFNTLQVTVVPRDKETIILTRAGTQDDYPIDIGVQMKLLSENNSELDPLMLLLESIAQFCIKPPRTLGNGVNATCIKVKYPAIFDPSQIREDRVFTGVVTATFRKLLG